MFRSLLQSQPAVQEKRRKDLRRPERIASSLLKLQIKKRKHALQSAEQLLTGKEKVRI